MFMIRKTIQSEIRPTCNLGRPPSACVSALAGLFLGDFQMKTIPLTQGKVAMVDDEEFVRLSKSKWYWDGHYVVRGRNPTIRMHREILKPPSGMNIDHRDHNGLNNQKSNLRFCTTAQNMANSIKHRGCSSKYKGVCWDKQGRRWIAYIMFNYQQIHLGCFDFEEQAAHAYDTAARKYFGEFALTNFLGEQR